MVFSDEPLFQMVILEQIFKHDQTKYIRRFEYVQFLFSKIPRHPKNKF